MRPTRPPAGRPSTSCGRRTACTPTRWRPPTGREQIDATIAAVQGQFPGLAFTLAGPVDAHHDIARFTWNLGDELVIGFDVLVLDADGRIATVYGFLDKVPA